MTSGGRPSVRSDGRAHLGQRPNHALHRPAGERGVAAHDGPELVRRDDSRHQPHRRARVAGIERAGGRGQPAQAAAVDLDDLALPGRSGVRRTVTPSAAQAGERREAVRPGEVAAGWSSGRRRAPPASRSGARWTCRRGPEGGRPHVRPASPGPRRLAREAFPHYNIGSKHQFPFLGRIRFRILGIRVRSQTTVAPPTPIVHSPRPDLSAPVPPPPHADTRRHGQTPGSQQLRHAGLRPDGQRPHGQPRRARRGRRPLDWRRRPRVGHQRHQARQPRGSRQAGDRRVHVRAGRRTRASSSCASSIRAKASIPRRSPIRWRRRICSRRAAAASSSCAASWTT